jgi:cytochrome bd-type quinol oxidase subunit 2
MNFLKRQMPVLLAFGFGMFFWAQYFIPTKWSQKALEQYNASWSVIIAAAALILGVLSAVHYHSTKIKRKRPGWAYSVITLCAFIVVGSLGLFSAHPTIDHG